MSILFYALVFILGAYLLFSIIYQQQKVARQKKIIEPVTEEADGHKLATIDYVSLIIKNSRWLQTLDMLDKRVELKMKIIGAIGVLLVGIKLLGIIELSMQGVAMTMVVVMVVIIVTPSILLNSAVKTRTKLMMDALPYYIDLTAVCVQSGMTVESALGFIGERFDDLDPNLASLMMYVVRRAEVSGLEGALLELYRSIDVTEMRMFSSTLEQSVHYGTSLYENLLELSKDIRELQLLSTEEKIGKLSAKMSVPLIIFIMFPIVILIAAPGILRIMKSAIF